MSDAVDRQLRELTKRAGGPLTIDASGFDSIGGYVHLLVTYWTWEPAAPEPADSAPLFDTVEA